MKKIIITALISLAGILAVSCHKEDISSDVKVGDTVPEFSVAMSDGSVYSSSADHGWTLVCFFNTDCSDCRDEFPHIQKVFDRLVGVKVVAVSRNEGESLVRKFFSENSYTFPYHADGGDSTYRLFASSVIPRCYLLKDRVVVACWDDSPVMSYADVLSRTGAEEKNQAHGEEFAVKLETYSVVLEKGSETAVSFTAAGFAGDVVATLPEGESQVSLSSSFDSSKGRGVLRFGLTADAVDKKVAVRFSDGASVVTADVQFSSRVQNPDRAPSEPVLSPASCRYWPAGSGIATEIGFSIGGDCVVDELTVSTGKGLVARVEAAADRRSGVIMVTAGEGAAMYENVTLTASNGAGSASATARLEKAYLNVDKTQIRIPSTSGTVRIYVSTNLEFSVFCNGGFADVRKEDGAVVISVPENPDWQDRSAVIRVGDSEKGYFEKTISLVQERTNGSVLSDKKALQAIYYALNGPEWTDVVVGSKSVRNWEDIDKDLKDWYYVTANYSGSLAGRADELCLMHEKNRKGVMPDDIGHLTALRQFEMFEGEVTGLPQTIRNLTRLQEFVIDNNPLNFRLDRHDGLKDMALNAPNLWEFCLSSCGLTGSIPEWLADMPEKVIGNKMCWCWSGNNLSGRVPDRVAAHAGWNRPWAMDVDGDGRDEIVTVGEEAMRTQGGGRYALWVGEQPDNVRFVNDADGGHWEWIGENPYLTKEYPEW